MDRSYPRLTAEQKDRVLRNVKALLDDDASRLEVQREQATPTEPQPAPVIQGESE